MYFLGVDGGTTKTLALIADEQGHIRGAARGAGSNWTGEDVSVPMAVVAATVREALLNSGAGPEQIEVGMFCLAGADWPEDHIRRTAALEAAGIARRVIVKNDAFGGLRAGTQKPYGIVLAAGTGFNAAAIAPDGREWAFGYYANYGGAASITDEALNAVMAAESGLGPDTTLGPVILDLLGVESVEALLKGILSGKIKGQNWLRICPLVFEAAAQGDQAAVQIILKQGQALVGYAAALVRRFEMQKLEFDLVLAGSVFKGEGHLLIETIQTEIHRTAPRARLVKPRFEPVVGSLLLAYDTAGVRVTDTIYRNLSNTGPGPEFYDTKNSAGYQPVEPAEAK